MGLLTGGPASGGAEAVFAPTELGQQAPTDVFTSKVVYATALDIDFKPADAETLIDIWVETDAGETYIRVESDAIADTDTSENWYNTGGSGQGDPGVDRNIMTLGTRVDSVNIYTKEFETELDVTHTQNWGSFTDDDKTTFFNPVNGTKYGYRLHGHVITLGSQTATSHNWIQFTCRKAGYTDLTFLYRGDITATAAGT